MITRKSNTSFLTPVFFIVIISLVILILPLYWMLGEHNNQLELEKFYHGIRHPMDCIGKQASLISENSRKTALTSFPRSGNTWVRLLVEKSTGYSTSSIYCDKLLRKTFSAECLKNNTFLVKTHYPVNAVVRYPNADAWKSYDQVIHLIRNPFDAILSYHSFHKTQNHVVKLENTIKRGKLEWYIQKYKAHYVYWENAPLHRLVVRFEDLKSSRHEMAASILLGINTFLLGEEGPSFDMALCAVGDTGIAYSSITQREPLFYSLKTWTADEVKLIIDSLGKIICQNGYHSLLKESISNFQLSSETIQHVLDLDCNSYDTVLLPVENNLTN